MMIHLPGSMLTAVKSSLIALQVTSAFDLQALSFETLPTLSSACIAKACTCMACDCFDSKEGFLQRIDQHAAFDESSPARLAEPDAQCELPTGKRLQDLSTC